MKGYTVFNGIIHIYLIYYRIKKTKRTDYVIFNPVFRSKWIIYIKLVFDYIEVPINCLKNEVFGNNPITTCAKKQKK